MGGILGMSELLTFETEGDAKTTAEIVFSSASRLMVLVNDLLDMSKLEAKRFEITHETFLLNEPVDEVYSSINILAKNKGLELEFAIEPELRREVTGDPYRMRQVLQNLVQNAIKFTESGKVSVTVTKQAITEDTVTVLFTIADTGCGISVENQKKLFKMFVQVDGTNTRKHGGTGLGLFLSKQLVELMGGEIGVYSEKGRGSAFFFTIPFKTSPVSEPAN